MIIDVVIKGKQDLLIHKYVPSTVSKPPVRKADSIGIYKNEWKLTTYTNKEGVVVLPSLNLMACLFDGAKGQKKGKVALTRRIHTSLVISPLEMPILFEDKKITLGRIEKEGWIYTTGAVVQQRRIDRTRTKLPPGWTVYFQILTLNDELSEEDIKRIVIPAGETAGLGDWRPSAPRKPGPYGTFDIVGWQVVG